MMPEAAREAQPGNLAAPLGRNKVPRRGRWLETSSSKQRGVSSTSSRRPYWSGGTDVNSPQSSRAAKPD